MALLELEIPPPKVRVFVADDIHVIMRTLAAVLNLAGYDACAIYGGDAALRLLNLLKPELIVVDVTEPSSSGMQLMPSSVALQVLRCKVLLFTGPSDLYRVLQGEVSPAVELLTRPIQADDLLSKLQQSLCSEQPPVLVPLDLEGGALH